MLLRSQGRSPARLRGELTHASCIRDHSLQPRCRGPGAAGAVGALATGSSASPLGSRAPCTLQVGRGSAMAGGPRLPCSFQCLVWAAADFLPSTLGLPTREARFSRSFHQGQSPRSQLHPQHLQNSSPGAKPSSAPATSAGTRGVSPARLARDRKPSGRPHACIVSVSHSKDTQGHTRSGGEGKGLGAGGPARPPRAGLRVSLRAPATSLWWDPSLTQHSQQGARRGTEP